MNELTDFKYNSVDMPLESFHFKYFVTWNFSLSETREMHWCEYHLINKGRALTANGNEALIDLTVQMSPSIHKLWSVSYPVRHGSTISVTSPQLLADKGIHPNSSWSKFVLDVRIVVRENPGYSEVFFIPLKALDSFFYHATDLNEVFFNP